ncbi:MAG: urea carboxylase-associated family protein [Firmicutes bacterium]|nr:urea carboxylase-associated family protein [Bacillota bacterium]
MTDRQGTFRAKILPGTAVRVSLGAGDRLRVVDLEGSQVADLVAFVADRPDAVLSASHTRTALGRLSPGPGDLLYDTRRLPVLRLVEDSVGVHDLLYPCCDPERYRMLGGHEGHPNCRDALAAALPELGRVPDPWNVFMRTSVDAEGRLTVERPLSRAGDHVVVEALVPLTVAVSACPMDLNDCNGGVPSAIGLERIEAGGGGDREATA